MLPTFVLTTESGPNDNINEDLLPQNDLSGKLGHYVLTRDYVYLTELPFGFPSGPTGAAAAAAAAAAAEPSS